MRRRVNRNITHGKFEHQGDAERYVDEQIEILGDGDYRLDIVAHPDAEQELETIAEGQEVSEAASGDEEARGQKNEGEGQASLFFVEARGNERPELIYNPG